MVSGDKAAATLWLAIAVVFVLGLSPVYGRLGHRLPNWVMRIRSGDLNIRDRRRMVRGYYQDLILGAQLDGLDGSKRKPPDWVGVRGPRTSRGTGDYRGYELRPGISTVFKGARFTVNSAGFRDREYPKLPGPGTFRIVILGASHSMGAGVADDEVFEQLLEARLNRELGSGSGRSLDILNCSIGGYTLMDYPPILERALEFNPDIVMLIATPWEAARIRDELNREIKQWRARPTLLPPYLRETIVREGAVDRETIVRMEREVASAAVERIYERACTTGNRPLWVRIPSVWPLPAGFDHDAEEARVAAEEKKKFIEVNIEDAYDPVPPEDRAALAVAAWDEHPNARAHRLLAERLFAALMDVERRIPTGLVDPSRRSPCYPDPEAPEKN